ncbi:uncharacterized protein LOC125206166 [Salvia hispanica]|uniref:uncharacterized protein LOC125206166 n=1 Tax=Salvia hispanica TaxID=49212 RepID=UPI0020091DF5|nr:uncharacterized protein LOC125206166 [Salvia hispanica]
MLDNIDCLHWKWKNCPNAWRGQHLSGDKGDGPTLILEAVADYRLGIWHAYFGAAGSNNDLNVLYSSPHFKDLLDGVALIDFTINDHPYHMGYYLADGIYSRWPTFVKTFNTLQDPKRILYTQRQEADQKDVERAFVVLQARFNIVKTSSRMWYANNIADIMYTCIILYNMIIDDEGPREANFFDEDEAGCSTARSPTRRGVHTTVRERSERRLTIRDTKAHIELQEDLINHIWEKFGHELCFF